MTYTPQSSVPSCCMAYDTVRRLSAAHIALFQFPYPGPVRIVPGIPIPVKTQRVSNGAGGRLHVVIAARRSHRVIDAGL